MKIDALVDGPHDPADALMAKMEDPDGPAVYEIAEFVRKIGRQRATPNVIGQQLRILGLHPTGELTPLEALIVKSFVTTLCDLDEFDREEEARRLAAANVPPVPVPLPIEDTTFEPADVPYATW